MAYSRTTWADYPSLTTPITAARLNNIEAMLDSISGAGDAWTSYTPTYTNVTLGTSPTHNSYYIQIGKTVHVRTVLNLGTGGALTGAPTLTVPVTMRGGVWSAAFPLGVAWFRDVSPFAEYTGLVQYLSTTTVGFVVQKADATYTTSAALSATVPFTWTDSDRLYGMFTYEAA